MFLIKTYIDGKDTWRYLLLPVKIKMNSLERKGNKIIQTTFTTKYYSMDHTVLLELVKMKINHRSSHFTLKYHVKLIILIGHHPYQGQTFIILFMNVIKSGRPSL